ncbi:hypothetical protein H8L32_19295 [Undibacterium sp. CY18W]|uniref:Uncharacterized protein n=1 Tax=Undibacterium hunanense TaxID=2762292 RepID=A0ABR6ZUV6_9BURK|nr:hypothetical protein [Undibacterium hunanense]MBC3919642.1 hypothetical protein [Undibacterium hunanense]
MEFDTITPEPQGRPSNAAGSSLSLEDWDKPAAKKPEPAPAPSSQRELTGHDISNLNPKQFHNANLGLEFYAPGAWREVKNTRSIHLHDAATDTRMEANGFARAEVSIERWVGMRLPMLEKEMPHLKQVARPAVIKGENWGYGIQGIAAEYRGRAHGDEEDTCMIICCMCTDELLLSITITAKASVFEANRAVYHWIFSRSDISNPLAVMGSNGSSNAGNTSNTGRSSAVGSRHSASNKAVASRGNTANATSDHDAEIGSIASGQRLFIFGILLSLFLASWMKNVNIFDRTELMISVFLCLLVAATGLFGFFRMAKGFAWSGRISLVMFVLSCIPLVSLFTFLFMNFKASARLKEEGYKVGLLGAPSAIPDNNHDMRNILVCCVVLSLIGYGVLLKISKGPKEEAITAFSPPDHSFSVSLPGKPVEQAAKVAPGVTNNHSYALHAGKFFYGITYFELPSRPADVSGLLDNIRNSAAQGENTIVSDDHMIRLDGNPGRSLRLEAKGLVRQAHYYVIDKTIYIIEVATEKNEANSPKIAAFMDSFHVN